MLLQSETGHAKNVANFSILIAYLKSMGSIYNPSERTIQLSHLTILKEKLNHVMFVISNASPVFTMAVNNQKAIFEPLNKFVTQIVKAYTSSAGYSSETLLSLQKKIAAKAMYEKYRKFSEKKITDGDVVSKQQCFYNNRITNFEQLVKIVEADSTYTPPDPTLKVAVLQLLVQQLRQKTEAVAKAYKPIMESRLIRNRLLYDKKEGLIALTGLIKTYLLSIFETDSPQIKYVEKLRFITSSP